MKGKTKGKRYEIEFSCLKRESIEIDASSPEEARLKAWEWIELDEEFGRGSSDFTHGWEITYVGELGHDDQTVPF